MAEKRASVRYSLNNLSLGRARFTQGIDEARELLGEIGAHAGFAWTPIRSRLYGQMMVRMARDDFSNEVDGIGLIASMDQSFAPTVPQAIKRYRGRAGTMSTKERSTRFALNIAQRGVMPTTLSSLRTMTRIAIEVNDSRLFANMYAEELPEGRAFTDNNAPYVRSQQITPDLVERLGTDVHNLPGVLSERGVSKLSFSTYHAERASFSGKTTLPAWKTYLPDFARQGLIRQVAISFNRQDLPAATGQEAMERSSKLAGELTRENPRVQNLGDLPDQIACIMECAPSGQDLDITVTGDVSGMARSRLVNVYANLSELVARSGS